MCTFVTDIALGLQSAYDNQIIIMLILITEIKVKEHFTKVTLRIHIKIVLDLFNKRFPGYSSIYICTCLSILFVSPSFIPHCQRNSYIHLFFETQRARILPHTHIRIRMSLLRSQSNLAHKIIHIAINNNIN